MSGNRCGSLFNRYAAVFIVCCIILVYNSLNHIHTRSTMKSSSYEVIKQLNDEKFEIENTTYREIQIVYKDISHCPRPEYFPEVKAHCWGVCKVNEICSVPVTLDDVNSRRADHFCMANLHLIGVRKCGTTDFSKYFNGRKDIAHHIQDLDVKYSRCPDEYFMNNKVPLDDVKNGMYSDGPGNLLIKQTVDRNSTHLTIVSSAQYLGHMVTRNTRFYATLRNPADRAISYFFQWHRENIIYPHLSHKDLTAEFVDAVVRNCLTRLKQCIAVYGPTYCVFQSDGYDGDMKGLLAHSMYFVYIKEAFKFIPREQVLFKTTAEYSENTVEVLEEVEGFYGIPFQEGVVFLQQYKVVNRGKKNPVWDSTLKLLDDFYEPYNIQLAELLGDDKWLFPAQRN